MTAKLRRDVRRQLGECFEDPASLPESLQAFLAMVDEAYQDVEIDLARSGLSAAGMETLSLHLDSANHEPIRVVASTHPEISIDSLPDIVFMIDEDGTILDCRGGDSRDLAFPRDRLIGKRVTQCPFGNIGSQFADAIDATRTTRTPVSIEYALPCDNGLEHFEARLTQSDDRRRLVVVRNTTRKAKAESVIRRSEAEYRGLVDLVQAAILLLDPATGTIVECNRKARSLYQVGRVDLIGSRLSNMFVDSEMPELHSIESGTSRRIEARHRFQDDRVALA